MVMCCEDAVSLEDLYQAEINVLEQLNYLNKELADNLISINDIPLIFVRVRNPNLTVSPRGLIRSKQNYYVDLFFQNFTPVTELNTWIG